VAWKAGHPIVWKGGGVDGNMLVWEQNNPSTKTDRCPDGQESTKMDIQKANHFAFSSLILSNGGEEGLATPFG